jgi:hypothetical protein
MKVKTNLKAGQNNNFLSQGSSLAIHVSRDITSPQSLTVRP